jgi:flagellar biosynthesis protein FlhF
MILKSFFGNGIKAALDQARQEMGPEAMLVSSRPAPPEARHLGDYEVVVASGEAAPGATPPPPAGRPVPPMAVQREPLASGLAQLEKKLDQVAAAITRAALGDPARGGPVDLPEACAELVRNEVDPELVREVALSLRALGPGLSRPELDLALRAELAGRLKVDPTLGRPDGRPRVVALAGPCASGKTTTLVKLAVRYGLGMHRPTQILSMDSYRVGASEQLRSYAAILGVGFQTLETIGALSQALEEHRNKDLILIDTPGYGVRDLDAAEDLARFLAGRPDIDTHLVLTSSMRSADLTRVVDRFGVFRPSKLVFAKLDETGTFGPILNQVVRTGKPVSFLAAGQQIPEDLEPATLERVSDLLTRPAQPVEAVAA